MFEAAVIETERLLLRPFAQSDLPSVNFYTDPDVMRFIPGGARDPAELAERFLAVVDTRLDEWKRLGFGMWAVILKGSGALIGQCGLQPLPDGDDVEVYYLLDKPYWNQGMGTEAAKAAIRFGFERAGLRKIVAIAMPENIGSQRVMEKSGMRLEGNASYSGHDVVLFAITNDAPAGEA